MNDKKAALEVYQKELQERISAKEAEYAEREGQLDSLGQRKGILDRTLQKNRETITSNDRRFIERELETVSTEWDKAGTIFNESRDEWVCAIRSLKLILEETRRLIVKNS